MIDLSRRLLRGAIAAYPRSFRDDFAADLEETMLTRVRRARARSVVHGAAMAAFCLFDTMISGLAERRRLRRLDSPLDRRSLLMTWESILADVRLAVRQCRRSPLFAILTVVCLAIGIGANSAIFSVVYAVLLRPLPYTAPDRLMAIWSDNTKAGEPSNPVSPANYEAMRALPAFSGVEAMYSFLVTPQVTIDAEPEAVNVSAVTPGMFALLGRQALHGRPLQPGDPQSIAVISHQYWVRRFGGDPNVVGRTVRTTSSAVPITIAGVMPEDFVFPYRSMLGPSGFTRASQPDVWLPLTRASEGRLVDASGQPNRNIHFLAVIGRLAPGVTREDASRALTTVAQQREQEFPDTNAGWGLTVRPLHEQTVGALRPALVTLLFGVGVVLLITCINVANVLLSRAAGHRRDLAVRAALGASRGRLAQQTLVETTVLAVAGGAAGLGVMALAVRGILAVAPSSLPRLGEVSPGWIVASFALLLSVITGIAVGLLPALQAGRSRMSEALADNPRTTTSRNARRLRSGLIVSEVALAMALTVGAGLLLRSFVAVLGVDEGFNSPGLLTMQVSVPPRYGDSPSRVAFYDDLEVRLRALPGVTHVGGTTRLPLGSTNVSTFIEVEGRSIPRSEFPEVEMRRSVSDYFGAMGVPLVAGRDFGPDDNLTSLNLTQTGAVVVNTAFVARVFPGEEPVGRRVRMGGGTSPWLTIVGVVGSVRHGSLEETPRPEIYIPYRQGPPISPYLVIRTSGDAESLAPAVRETLRQLGVNPPTDVRTMSQIRSASVGPRRFVLLLVTLFGGVALALAAVGVYGVVALAVGERTAEVGLRLALGARPSQILGLVFGQAMVLAGVGIAAGVALSAAGAPLVASQLFGVSVADPITYAGVAAILAGVAAIAAIVPARRALRVDPASTLRGIA
jgi:predicted permease